MPTLAQAKALSLIRMIASPISVIASVIVIVMIMRSTRRLTTTQHRLLVALSISDIIASLAMSLGSIPMPRETDGVWMARGTVATCEAQGFFVHVTSILTPCYNAALCVFYLLKVRYDMSDDRISQKVEPFLHGIPLSLGLFAGFYCLFNDYFNPTLSVCHVNSYPDNCDNDDDDVVECERGGDLFEDWATRSQYVVAFIITPLVIFGTMGTIYLTVLRQEQRMATYGRGSITLATSEQEPSGQSQQTRMVMYRGLAYSGAWLMTYFFASVFFFLQLFGAEPPFVLRILVTTTYPLQGFFNFVVFIYPKVLHARRVNPDCTFFQAFRTALKSNAGEAPRSQPGEQRRRRMNANNGPNQIQNRRNLPYQNQQRYSRRNIALRDNPRGGQALQATRKENDEDKKHGIDYSPIPLPNMDEEQRHNSSTTDGILSHSSAPFSNEEFPSSCNMDSSSRLDTEEGNVNEAESGNFSTQGVTMGTGGDNGIDESHVASGASSPCGNIDKIETENHGDEMNLVMSISTSPHATTIDSEERCTEPDFSSSPNHDHITINADIESPSLVVTTVENTSSQPDLTVDIKDNTDVGTPSEEEATAVAIQDDVKQHNTSTDAGDVLSKEK